MQYAGIILCGGSSTRMGLPKAALPFGPELMLQRVARLLDQAVGPIVVVAAREQELPPLPPEILIVHDRRQGRGPLQGMAAGMSALRGKADAAYVTGCDVPLLRPSFVRRVCRLLGDARIAVPCTEGYHHPLAAVYRLEVLPHVEALLADDRLRSFYLFERVPTREISAEELTDVDPRLESLLNLNRPQDYFDALARAGFTAPADVAAALAQPLA